MNKRVPTLMERARTCVGCGELTTDWIYAKGDVCACRTCLEEGEFDDPFLDPVDRETGEVIDILQLPF